MRSYTVLCALIPVLILAMCQAESHSARLTAFGKTPNQNQPKNNKHTLERQCKSDMDCSRIQNTTCMSDYRDNKMRCLCRDSSLPLNGACPNHPQALRSTCTSSNECVEGSECKLSNATTSGHTSKMCLCKDGFIERDNLCSGALTVLPSLVTLVTATLLTHFVSNRYLRF